jgi:hypothetical protein
MNKENIEQIKHELFHDYSWTSTKIDELDLLIEDVIEATEQQLILSGVSQQRELLELVTEIANSNQVYSNTRHKLWAKKLISSNCG